MNTQIFSIIFVNYDFLFIWALKRSKYWIRKRKKKECCYYSKHYHILFQICQEIEYKLEMTIQHALFLSLENHYLRLILIIKYKTKNLTLEFKKKKRKILHFYYVLIDSMNIDSTVVVQNFFCAYSIWIYIIKYLIWISTFTLKKYCISFH